MTTGFSIFMAVLSLSLVWISIMVVIGSLFNINKDELMNLLKLGNAMSLSLVDWLEHFTFYAF